jgi:hypothetical protein
MMKQLFQVKNGAMFVNPKLPKLEISISNGGGASSSTTSTYDAAYQAAYASLSTDQKAKVDSYNGYTTVYSSYPCKDNVSDWKNFVKYAVIKNNTTALDAFSLVWSSTVTTTTPATTTYTPTTDVRMAGLQAYNAYVADAGKTTGVKPACKAVQSAYVTTPTSSNLPYQNLES